MSVQRVVGELARHGEWKQAGLSRRCGMATQQKRWLTPSRNMSLALGFPIALGGIAEAPCTCQLV